jgi:hypothetical protein
VAPSLCARTAFKLASLIETPGVFRSLRPRPSSGTLVSQRKTASNCVSASSRFLMSAVAGWLRRARRWRRAVLVSRRCTQRPR